LPRRVARRARVAVAITFASLVLGTLVPSVTADDGLEVTTAFPSVAVAPGDDVSFDLVITSTRSAIVELSLGGVPEGWSASLLGGGNVVEGVSVTPDVDGEVRLDVDVPAEAAAGSATINVRAAGGGAVDVLPITIRVDADAAGDIALTTSTPTLTGSTDASFSFTLEFRNDTAQDVTLSVSALGDVGWDVTATLTGEAQAASTVVEAGSTQGVTVAATAPEDAPAGLYPITVEATAGDRTTTAELAVEITGSYAMTLTTPDDRLSASGSAGSPTTLTFEVTNTGTAPLSTVEVTATPPTGWDVTFDPASVAAIAPNDTATVTATITPSGEAVAGDYVVSFSASAAEEAASGAASIRFTVETSPLWAAVGIGLIVLILAGLFYVFRTYGRR
jgi:uncharacterized repeat protein (TIGR01451 family)